jgi:signal transduction histidine kinase
MNIMQKSSVSFLILLVLGLFLITAGCTQNQPGVATSTSGSTEIQQETYTSNETLVAFVESAAAYVKTNGKEKALAEFNNPNGSFIRGELYIYAYDFNGTTLAHPVNPEKVGVNRLDEGDTGTYLRGTIDAVRNGSGFYRIQYVNPTHNRTLESKLVYGVSIDDDWLLGSGIYTGPADRPPMQ